MASKDDLIEYFIHKTDERFESIDKKLADLTQFKIEMVVNARWVAMITSLVVGVAGFAANVGFSIYMQHVKAKTTQTEGKPQ